MSWNDGVCIECGSVILEEGSSPEQEGYKLSDYRNRCSNKNCKNNIWHYVFDTEELNYYNHKRG